MSGSHQHLTPYSRGDKDIMTTSPKDLEERFYKNLEFEPSECGIMGVETIALINTRLEKYARTF
jgi:hypothetical protein